MKCWTLSLHFSPAVQALSQDLDLVFLIGCSIASWENHEQELGNICRMDSFPQRKEIFSVPYFFISEPADFASCHKLMKWGCWQNNRYRPYYHCPFLGETQATSWEIAKLILGDKGWCITNSSCKPSSECKSRAPFIFCVLMEETPAGLSIK